MGSNTATLALVGLGALALFTFKKDVSGVLKPVGDTLAVIPNRFSQATSGFDVVQAGNEGFSDFLQREFDEFGERSSQNQFIDLLELQGKIDRERIEQLERQKREKIQEEAKTQRERDLQTFLSGISSSFLQGSRNLKKNVTNFFSTNFLSGGSEKPKPKSVFTTSFPDPKKSSTKSIRSSAQNPFGFLSIVPKNNSLNISLPPSGGRQKLIFKDTGKTLPSNVFNPNRSLTNPNF